MISVLELIQELSRHGVQLSTDGAKLRIRAPKGLVSAELRAELAARKAELQAFFREQEQAQAPVRHIETPEPLPLSSGQEALWLTEGLLTQRTLYNVPLGLHITGPLDGAALARSLNAVVAQHDILRTTFHEVDGRPRQVVAPELSIALPLHDLSDLPRNERELALELLRDRHEAEPFDLTAGPLLRAALVRLAPHEHVMLVTKHHLITDGFSAAVFARSLGDHYRAALTRASPPAPPSLQYGDFARWERQELREPRVAAQRAYWKGRLAGLPLLELPTEKPKSREPTYRGTTLSFALPAPLGKQLKAMAIREGCTLFAILFAGFATLLHRYSHQTDFGVRTAVANRQRAEFHDQLGLFMNRVILRCDFSGAPTVSALLGRLRRTIEEAIENQEIPFAQVVQDHLHGKERGLCPLDQVIFVLESAPAYDVGIEGVRFRPALRSIGAAVEGTSKTDLGLFMVDMDGTLRGSFEYSTDLFDRPTIERMRDHLERLLAAMTVDPWQPVGRLALLSDAERRRLLIEWNDTRSDYPEGLSCHRIFEQQAERTPDELAVAFELDQLSYAELNCRANQLARHLRALGVDRGTVVGLCLDPSLELIVGWLAVMKAGGAYLPIDPSYPKARIAFMLENAAAPLLLSQSWLSFARPTTSARVLCLDELTDELSCLPGDNLDVPVGPDDPAYVIYTSGSTGKPKGVLLRHRGLENLHAAHVLALGLGPGDRLLQFFSFAFDGATSEITAVLLTGASLFLCRREEIQPGRELAQLMREREVTVAILPPSALALLDPEAIPSLRTIVSVGEACRPELVARWSAGRRFFNAYGPTEATICATIGLCTDPSRNPPIGRPIGNTRIYLLDENLEPVPVGVSGELHIEGPGLAIGYLNRPELTAQQFIQNPFSTDPASRLYKTGDLARYRSDGELEYLGRIDQQAKLRGYRIELGEIENTISAHPAVRQCVVTLREDRPGDQRLVAYLTSRPAGRPPESMPPQKPSVEQEAKLVQGWQMLYDELQSQAPVPRDPTCNIVGWKSSYTGQPIPEPEMREWVDASVGRILAHTPSQVLEIGCGTGLLLFHTAPRCARYLATDFSSEAIVNLERILAHPEHSLSQVSLVCQPADDFQGIEPYAFDAVVVNSVIQYFPSVDYLLRVLEGAARAVRPGGFLYLGDIRDLGLLHVLAASIELSRAPPDLARAELRHRAETRAEGEEELLVDPAFFLALPARIPRISHVSIQPRRGRAHNELTRFRYDVVLYLERGGREAHDAAWEPWQDRRMDAESVRRWLGEARPEQLALRGVPSARIAREVAAAKLLASEDGPTDASHILAAAAELAREAIDPEDLWALEGSIPYRIEIRPSPASKGSFDVIFSRSDTGEPLPFDLPLFPQAQPTPLPWGRYTNDPLSAKRPYDVVPALRRFLAERLPEFMVPSSFIVLDAFPVTVSGKVDKKALPVSDSTRAGLSFGYVAPRNAVEERIAAVWAEVLGKSEVGVHDNFFELGGYSLLATQLISKLSADFSGLRLPMIFTSPTVAALAEQAQAMAAQAARPAPPNPPESPSSRPASIPSAAGFGPGMSVERRSLLTLFASGKLAPVDAAAIGAIPAATLTAMGLCRADLVERWMEGLPLWGTALTTAWGRIALIGVPVLDSEIYRDPPALLGSALDAMELSAKIGARFVSLTGLIPSATDNGRSLAAAAAARGHLPGLTTGHATTAAAIVTNLRHVLDVAGRSLQSEHVAVLGLGSIGRAVLRLSMRCLPKPRAITLCDVYGKRDLLDEAARELRERWGFAAEIGIAATCSEAPPQLYDASVIIGATNVPDVVDVGRLRPGTVLIDDSAPHCFPRAHAIRRLETRGDILFTEGGGLALPHPTERLVHLPSSVSSLGPLGALLEGNSHIVMGCTLSSLLSARFPEASPTIGDVDVEVAFQHYETLERLGIRGTPLHCEEYDLPVEIIQRFQERFGASRPDTQCV
jgi:amino acid adenylation domain-containing protein